MDSDHRRGKVSVEVDANWFVTVQGVEDQRDPDGNEREKRRESSRDS
jgi:hypothetical protein